MDDRPQSRPAVEQSTAVRRGTLAQADLLAWFAKAFGEVAGYLSAHGITPKGYPFARYHVRADARFDVEAGFPLAAPISGDTSVVPSDLPAGLQAMVWHTGPYDSVGESYAALADWIEAQGGRPSGDPWEIYHDPPTGDPARWRTEVVQPYVLETGGIS